MLFAHIPKAGGTSVENMFRNLGWNLHLIDGGGGARTLNPALKASPQHWHAMMLSSVVDFSKLKANFTVIRNPLDRAISEYFWRRTHFKLDMDFETWLTTQFAAYHNNPFVLDNHIRPQSQFICRGAKVFRLEDGLDLLSDYLVENLGEDPSKIIIPHHMKSHRDLEDQIVSDTVIKMIERFYARDFQLWEQSENTSSKTKNSVHPRIAEHKDALIRPTGIIKKLGKRTIYDGGAFDASNRPLANSRHRFSGLQHRPEITAAAKKVERLEGCYFYLGMLQSRHFGHVVAEGLSRIWALNEVQDIDGLVFTPIYMNPPNVADHVYDVFSTLCPDKKLIPILQATEVEKLILAEPHRLATGVLDGTSETKKYLSERVSEIVAADRKQDRSKRVYISRSKLLRSRPVARIFLEEVIEENLQAEGYSIIHPQEISFFEQLKIYHSAEELIFADGSTLHAYVLAARPEQRVFCIHRREGALNVFQEQLKCFDLPSSFGEFHMEKFYPHRNMPNNGVSRMTQLNFASLRNDLKKNNFIDGKNWLVPNETLIAQELKKFNETHITLPK